MCPPMLSLASTVIQCMVSFTLPVMTLFTKDFAMIDRVPTEILPAVVML